MTELDAEDANRWCWLVARWAGPRRPAERRCAISTAAPTRAPVALDALQLTALQAARRGGGPASDRCGGRGGGWWLCRRRGRGCGARAVGRRDSHSSPTGRHRALTDSCPRPRNRVPFRLRLLRRQAEHRKVDTDQRAGRREGRDHVEPPADHPAHDSRHRASRELPGHPRRHPRPAPAAHTAGPAAQRPRQGHLFGGRHHRAGASRPTRDRPRGQVDLRADPHDRAEYHAGRRRDQDRQGVEGPGRRAAARGERARRAGHRDRSGVGDHRRESRRLDRRARRPAAARPGVLPRRGAHRRARGGADGRADPRGCAGRRAR